MVVNFIWNAKEKRQSMVRLNALLIKGDIAVNSGELEEAQEFLAKAKLLLNNKELIDGNAWQARLLFLESKALLLAGNHLKSNEILNMATNLLHKHFSINSVVIKALEKHKDAMVSRMH